MNAGLFLVHIIFLFVFPPALLFTIPFHIVACIVCRDIELKDRKEFKTTMKEMKEYLEKLRKEEEN